MKFSESTTATINRQFIRGIVGAGLLLPALAITTVLTACGDTDSATKEAKSAVSSAVDEAKADAKSDSTGSSAGSDSSDGATGTENVTADATPTEGLSDGDTITITLAGLDPESGYYTAICAKDKEEGNPVPTCAGDRSIQGTQAWVSNRDGATHEIAADGTAKVELLAASTAEGVDCSSQECVLKIFGDHREGFGDIVDIPVTFAQ